MTPSDQVRTAERKLAALSDTAQAAVRMIVRTSVQDGKNTLRHMTPGPLSQRILEVALDLEKTGAARTGILDPIRSALKRCSVAQSVAVEVLPNDSMTLPSTTLDPQSTIAQINDLHASATTLADQARALGETATRKAILLGLKLTALKDATPHGKWESLFASGQRRVGKSNVNHGCHLLEFGFETARRYISVAANLMSQRLSSEQSAALMQLAARPETTDLSPAEASFLDEVVPEKSLRQLYLSMGIVKPTRMEQRHLDDAGDSARVPDPPKPPKRKLTLAEEHQLRKDLARKLWFGTLTPGMVDTSSLLHTLNQESNNPAESQLNYLGKIDLQEVETTLRDLLKITKHLLSEL